jgi:hypothetical protein
MILCLLWAGAAGAQTVTPNVQLQIPSYQQKNWQVPYDYDMTLLDRVIAASAPLPTGPTPTISQQAFWVTQNSSATIISNLLGGLPQQTVHLVCGVGDLSSITGGPTMLVAGPWTCPSGISITLVLFGTQWTEVARSGGGAGSTIFGPQAPFTIFAGPGANSTTGIADGFTPAVSSSTSLAQSVTLQPGSTHDWMFFALSADAAISQSGGPVTITGGGTWTNDFSGIGNNGGLWSQILTTSAPITSQGNASTNPTNWAGMMFSLALKPATTPSIVQTQGVSGSVNNGSIATFSGNTTPGNSVLVLLIGGGSGSSTTLMNDTISDSQGNVFTLVGSSLNGAGAGECVLVFLTANITAATADVVKFNVLAGPGVSGSMQIFEVSNLALANGLPTFRKAQLGDLTGLLPYTVGGFTPGTLTASQILLAVPVGNNVTFAANFAGSQATLQTAATASTVFLIDKIVGGSPTQIGTITFSAAGTVGVFASTSGLAQGLSTGNVLEILAPASPDATAALIGFTIKGTQ